MADTPDRTWATDELRLKCKAFRSGDPTTERFERVLAWATKAPRKFGAFEYLVELDSNEVTKPVAAWAKRGREALWCDEDWKRNGNLERLQAWQPPPPPVRDGFNLVRYWPCYMEALRPLPRGSEKLLERANDVYHFLAGAQCYDAEYSVAVNKYQHPYDTFVLASCVVHFKVIGPILRELDAREETDDVTKKLKDLLESFCDELIKVRDRVSDPNHDPDQA
ncbi:uncharacterized protein N0V89_011796 [Didymosphaeria variabile]|uniref:Uncharacterized protein n=1 Tax=Didymosphaeria variabile TaxID=1932322 RepID=A0A9W9C529_9PLEO|nr:uncharacterized protein N0V89_011796 [Didymosphaeria variabile]KAJ4345661.1 hypothetical protein N0V89_011796 [Didymosphaeria variabile]